MDVCHPCSLKDLNNIVFVFLMKKALSNIYNVCFSRFYGFCPPCYFNESIKVKSIRL